VHGLMQDWPLLCHKIIDHAALYHGDREVISRSTEGAIHKTKYAELRRRSLRLAKCLGRAGIRPGDRVATLAWNTWRHMEAWYGIMGAGAVCHTVNPRLFHDQIVWIINDAGDRLLLTDLTFVPLLEKLADRLPTIERYVVLTDAEHMPATSLPNAMPYEEWLDEVDDDFAWVSVEENDAAGMCYTSGTTGHPKGVVYSHRSNVIHALMVNTADMFGVRASDIVMPVVPMFHANCWGLAHCSPMAGAALVLPGPKLDGPSLYTLINDYKVTLAAAVPTLWLGLLQYLEDNALTLPVLERVVIGGAACPRRVIETFQDKYGVEVQHAWGMTETSPLGTICFFKSDPALMDRETRLKQQEKQGHPAFGFEMKITDDDGLTLPRDGKTFGRLKVKGPAVASAYYHSDGASVLDGEGYFDTGDIATIDADGYMQITDRSKDIIKSGGEWISSIELENLAVGHPKVAEAAVIGLRSDKWGERPLLIVVLRPGQSATGEELLGFLADKVAKWWLPDEVAFVSELPHTAAGKILKTALRERFKDSASVRG
jgi:fatty-acyl-CoA synthase